MSLEHQAVDPRNNGEIRSPSIRLVNVALRAARKSARPFRRGTLRYGLDPNMFGPFPALQQKLSMRIRSNENLQDFRRHTGLGEPPEMIFLHIPRTAGTAISQMLTTDLGFDWAEPRSPARSPLWILDHYDPSWLIRKRLLDPSRLSGTSVFTVVRNPFDRATSLFSFLKKRGKIPSAWNLEDFLRGVMRARPVPGGSPVARLSMASPQSRWTGALDAFGGSSSLFKFEDLSPLKGFLEQNFGANFRLQRLNASEGRPTLDSVCQSLVREIYEEDFDQFGYPRDYPEQISGDERLTGGI